MRMGSLLAMAPAVVPPGVTAVGVGTAPPVAPVVPEVPCGTRAPVVPGFWTAVPPVVPETAPPVVPSSDNPSGPTVAVERTCTVEPQPAKASATTAAVRTRLTAQPACSSGYDGPRPQRGGRGSRPCPGR